MTDPDPGLTIQDVIGELRAMSKEFNIPRYPLQIHYPMWRGQPLKDVFIQFAEALERSLNAPGRGKGGFPEKMPMSRTRVVEGEDAERIAKTLKENEEKPITATKPDRAVSMVLEKAKRKENEETLASRKVTEFLEEQDKDPKAKKMLGSLEGKE